MLSSLPYPYAFPVQFVLLSIVRDFQPEYQPVQPKERLYYEVKIEMANVIQFLFKQTVIFSLLNTKYFKKLNYLVRKQ